MSPDVADAAASPADSPPVDSGAMKGMLNVGFVAVVVAVAAGL